MFPRAFHLPGEEYFEIFYDPATIGILTAVIPAAISGVSAIGGIAEGGTAASRNAEMERQQRAYRERQVAEAQNLVNSVQRANYEKSASRDFSKAIGDVVNAMQARGLGSSSTAALAAVGEQSANIRSQYSQRYMQDRMNAAGALQGALSQGASGQPLGYNPAPYAGVGQSLEGLYRGLDNIGSTYGKGTRPIAAIAPRMGDAISNPSTPRRSNPNVPTLQP